VSIRPPPEREITKIPLKFQKQSTKAPNTYSQRKAIKERNLPKARSEEAPASARRLTIFGTSNVVNNLIESDLSKELGVPVRIIPAMRLDVFQEKIELVDPELDRFVLIHKLGNDARALANKTEPDGKTPKKDVEKATEADQLASEFCEVVKDLVERIPYLKVAVSTLLPRFDQEDEAYMSNPNNVRKVMNVEIDMRLNDHPAVKIINNDEWCKWSQTDEEKKRRLFFGSDGYHLTPYGFGSMLDYWMKTLVEMVNQADLPPSPEDGENETYGGEVLSKQNDVIQEVSLKLQSSSIHTGGSNSDVIVDPTDCPLVEDNDDDFDDDPSVDTSKSVVSQSNEEKLKNEVAT